MLVTSEFYYRHILLYRELVTEEELRICTEAQDRAHAAGEPEPGLTDLMLEYGFLSPSQFQRIESEIASATDELRSGYAGPRIPGYDVEGLESENATGYVYRAVQKNLRRKVTVKVLNPQFLTDRRAVQQYYDEAAAAAKAGHPNIVQLIDLGFDPSGSLYVIRERVDGRSVAEMIAEQGRFDPDEAAQLVLNVARGLGYIHGLGLVHGHLRPSNILVPPDKIAKLQDLGLSRNVPETGGTGRKKLLGNPLYMSPEQVRGEDKIDGRSDIYALGATFYHMLTGQPPFVSDDPRDAKRIFDQHLNAPVKPPHWIVAGIPPLASEFLVRMLAKKPEDRFASADELAAELQDYCLRRAQWTADRSARLAAGESFPPPPRPLVPAEPKPAKPASALRTAEYDSPAPKPAEPPAAGPGPVAWAILILSILGNAALIALLLLKQKP